MAHAACRQAEGSCGGGNGWVVGSACGCRAAHAAQRGPRDYRFGVRGIWEALKRIEAEWGLQGRSAARMSLLWDFPFLVAYGAFWWLSARARRGGLRDEDRTVLAPLGRPAGACAVMAAGCDR